MAVGVEAAVGPGGLLLEVVGEAGGEGNST